MPDPEPDKQNEGTPKAEPVVAPAAEAKPPPAVVDPKAQSPPATPASPVSAPSLDPETPVEIPRKDGSGYEVATMQEMADALLASRSSPADPEAMKKFQAFNAALSPEGGNKAAHELVDLYSPAAAAPEPNDKEQLVAMQAELKATRAMVETHAPLMREIEGARVQSMTKGLIEQHTGMLPHLAKDSGEGARLVVKKLSEYRDAAKVQYGFTDEQFDQHPRRQQVLAMVLRDCESQLKSIVERFQGFDPKVAKPDVSGDNKAAGVIDDQPGAADTVGRIPARLQVGADGQLVDSQNRGVVQTAYGRMDTIPTEPLAAEPSGTAVGPQPSTAVNGPMDINSIKSQMRRRLQEMDPQ